MTTAERLASNPLLKPWRHPARYLKSAPQPNRFALGSRAERLNFCLLQCDLHWRWFEQTGDTFFKTHHDQWYNTFKQI